MNVNGTLYEGAWNYTGDGEMALHYVDTSNGNKCYFVAYEYKDDGIVNVIVNEELGVNFKLLYTAGDDSGDVDQGGEGEDVVTPSDPEQNKGFEFSFVSISYDDVKYYPGDSFTAAYNTKVNVVENYFTITLHADGTVSSYSVGVKNGTGTWRVFAGDVFVAITEKDGDYEFVLKYDEQANTVSFRELFYTYEVQLTNGLSYYDILGDLPGALEYTLNRVQVGESSVAVGDTQGDYLITEQSAKLVLFSDGTFKFTTFMTTVTYYGYWLINEDGSLDLTYQLDDEVFPFTVSAVEGENLIQFVIDDIFEYYLNGSVQSAIDMEINPPVESTPEEKVEVK